MINEIVLELDLRRIPARVGVVDPLEPRPIIADRHIGHSRSSVQLALAELKRLQPPARVADRHDLGVRRGIVADVT